MDFAWILAGVSHLNMKAALKIIASLVSGKIF